MNNSQDELTLRVKVGKLRMLIVVNNSRESSISNLKEQITRSFHSTFPTLPALLFFRIISPDGIYLTDDNPVHVLKNGDEISVERADSERPARGDNVDSPEVLIKILGELMLWEDSCSQDHGVQKGPWNVIDSIEPIDKALSVASSLMLLGCLLFTKAPTSEATENVAVKLSISRHGRGLGPFVPDDHWLSAFWRSGGFVRRSFSQPAVAQAALGDSRPKVPKIKDRPDAPVFAQHASSDSDESSVCSPIDCDIIKDLSKPTALRLREVAKIKHVSEYLACYDVLGGHPDAVSEAFFKRLSHDKLGYAGVVEDFAKKLNDPLPNFIPKNVSSGYLEVAASAFTRWIGSSSSLSQEDQISVVAEAFQVSPIFGDAWLGHLEQNYQITLEPSASLMTLIAIFRKDARGFKLVLRLLKLVASSWATREWLITASPGLFDFLVACVSNVSTSTPGDNDDEDIALRAADVIIRLSYNFEFRLRAKRSSKLLSLILDPKGRRPDVTQRLEKLLVDDTSN